MTTSSTHITPSPFVEGSFATVRPAEPVEQTTEADEQGVVVIVEQPVESTVEVGEQPVVVIVEQSVESDVEAGEQPVVRVVLAVEEAAEVPGQRRNRHEERDMQVGLADYLTTQGWEVTREHLLPSGAKVDIVATRPGFSPLVIECKLKLTTTGMSNRAFTQLHDQLGQIGRLGSRRSPVGVLVALEIDHAVIESVRETNLDVMMWTERGFRRYVRTLAAQANG